MLLLCLLLLVTICFNRILSYTLDHFDKTPAQLFRPSTGLTPYRFLPELSHKITAEDILFPISVAVKLSEIPNLSSCCFLRRGLQNIYSESSVWSLSAGLVLPESLNLCMMLDAKSPDADLLVLSPSSPMTFREYQKYVTGLPWEKMPGTPGQGVLETETVPFLRYPRFSVLCKALYYFIQIKKAMLIAIPEVFEDLHYAFRWKKRIEKLISLIESCLYYEVPLELVLSKRILRILNEVLVDWVRNENLGRQVEVEVSKDEVFYLTRVLNKSYSYTPKSQIVIGIPSRRD